jgi:hypothetical protein
MILSFVNDPSFVSVFYCPKSSHYLCWLPPFMSFSKSKARPLRNKAMVVPRSRLGKSSRKFCCGCSRVFYLGQLSMASEAFLLQDYWCSWVLILYSLACF